MTRQFDMLSPLTRQERDKAYAIASATIAALPSHGAPFVAEIVAHLLGEILYDLRDQPNVEEEALSLFQHVLNRIQTIACENEALARAAVARRS